MKSEVRFLAKVNVLSCEEKIERGTTRQALNRDGRPIWLVDVREETYNAKHDDTDRVTVTYKSLQVLEKGEQVVELKIVSMGEGKGDFVSVKNFYTIVRAIDRQLKIGDLFSLDAGFFPNKKAKSKDSIEHAQ